MDEELRSLFDRLHRQIRSADSVDPESRLALRELERDIHRLLNQPDDEERDLAGFAVRLGGAVTRFESTHPELTEALNRVINALNAIGL